MLARYSRMCFSLWSALWVWNKLSKLTHGHYTGRSASIVLLLRELSMFVVVLLLASFHTAKLSIIADMDTDKHTLEDSCHHEWHSAQRRIDWWGKKNTLIAIQPQTHYSTSPCLCVSECRSAFQLFLSTSKWETNNTAYTKCGGKVRADKWGRGERTRQTAWMNQRAHDGAETTNAKFSFLLLGELARGLICVSYHLSSGFDFLTKQYGRAALDPTRKSQGTTFPPARVEHQSYGLKRRKSLILYPLNNIQICFHVSTG